MKSILSKKICFSIIFFSLMLTCLFSGERTVIFSADIAEDKTLTQDDIIFLFKEKSLHYLNKTSQYLCDYSVYSSKEKQNFAWAIEIVSDKLDDEYIYEIWFHFSNGSFVLKTSNLSFTSLALGAKDDDERFSSAPINAATGTYINKELEACFDMSFEAYTNCGLKKEKDEEYPMNFYKFE